MALEEQQFDTDEEVLQFVQRQRQKSAIIVYCEHLLREYLEAHHCDLTLLNGT